MKRLKGKLSKDQLADFDSLLLELKALNAANLSNSKVIPIDRIVPLAKEKNERLWEYIRHYSRLVCMYPNNKKTLRGIAAFDDTVDMNDLVDDAVMDVSIWVYRFAWRQYVHSEECGYVFTTANFGFMAWSTGKKMWSDGKDSYKDSVEEADDHNESEPAAVPVNAFSELDFPLKIDDLESSITNP